MNSKIEFYNKKDLTYNDFYDILKLLTQTIWLSEDLKELINNFNYDISNELEYDDYNSFKNILSILTSLDNKIVDDYTEIIKKFINKSEKTLLSCISLIELQEVEHSISYQNIFNKYFTTFTNIDPESHLDNLKYVNIFLNKIKLNENDDDIKKIIKTLAISFSIESILLLFIFDVIFSLEKQTKYNSNIFNIVISVNEVIRRDELLHRRFFHRMLLIYFYDYINDFKEECNKLKPLIKNILLKDLFSSNNFFGYDINIYFNESKIDELYNMFFKSIDLKCDPNDIDYNNEINFFCDFKLTMKTNSFFKQFEIIPLSYKIYKENPLNKDKININNNWFDDEN